MGFPDRVNRDLQASFEETIENLTVVFRDTSEGGPSRWAWDFGDGRKSSVQHPTHTYSHEGSYVVELVVSRAGRSSEFSKTVSVTEEDVESEALFITDIDPETGPAEGGNRVTITGTGFLEPLRTFFGGVLAEPVSVDGTTRIVVKAPPGVLGTVDCDDDDDDTIGTKVADTPVTITVELQSGTQESVQGGYTYLAPLGAPCNGD